MTTGRSFWHKLVSALGRAEGVAWGAITSSYADTGLLAALLIVTLIGGLVPQAEPDLQIGSLRYQEWRGQLQPLWRASGDTLERLGLFRAFHSRLFYLLIALVAVVATLRLASLWIPSWVPMPPLGANVQRFVLADNEANVWTKLAFALREARLTIKYQGHHEGTHYAVAQRAGPARWMPGLLYLGVLALLVASAVERRFGWVGPRLDLVLGETRLYDRENGLAVRLEQIDLLPLPNGVWRRFDSHLSLIRGANVERELVLGLSQRAMYQDLAFYQLGFGPAVRLSAQKASGESLGIAQTVGDRSVQRVVRLRLLGRQQEQSLAIPEADRVARLVHYPSFPAHGSSGRALHVQLLKGSTGEVEAEQFLSQNGRIEARDIRLDVAFEYFVTLRAEREPGLPLAALGGTLVLLGLVGHFLWPPYYVWLIVHPEAQRCLIQLIAPSNEMDAPWSRALAARLTEEIDG